MNKKYATKAEQRAAAGQRQRDRQRKNRTWAQNVLRALRKRRGR